MNVRQKIILASSNMRYGLKDSDKFSIITKFIGRGSKDSSSHKYAMALFGIANQGSYDPEDIVGISVEGNRTDRVSFDKVEVKKALDQCCVIVTDNESNRNRSYNVGERELATFLTENDYFPLDCTKRGLWIPLGSEVDHEELSN